MTIIKYSKVLSYAKTCISNVELYKKANVGQYNQETLAYMFSQSILNPKKNVDIKIIKENPNPQGSKIDGGVGWKNFLNFPKLMINWSDKNKNVAPSYFPFNNLKVGIDVYTYAAARMVVYYHEKGHFPNKVLMSWKTFYVPPKVEPKKEEPKQVFRKYGHAEDYGCDDMGQNNDHYCGPHGLQELFRNLTDIVISQDTIAEICGTTSDGTDHPGLNTCVEWFNRTYGKNLKVEWKNFSEIGWDGIRNIVNSDNKDCIIHNLYRNQYGHYEVVNWVSDEDVGVQNSLGDRCNRGCFCGYKETRTQSEYRSYINGISQKSVMIITQE